MSGIRLSPKYGVNATLTICFYCGGETGVALLGLLKGDAEAPKRTCLDSAPCASCAEHIKEGVFLIEVDEEKSPDRNNPWRTGRLCVVKEEAIKRMLEPGDFLDSILKQRVAFVPSTDWAGMGLP
jgi:hypothetical protein